MPTVFGSAWEQEDLGPNPTDLPVPNARLRDGWNYGDRVDLLQEVKHIYFCFQVPGRCSVI